MNSRPTFIVGAIRHDYYPFITLSVFIIANRGKIRKENRELRH